MTEEKKKREIWPYAIIGAFAIFMSLVISAVVIMMNQKQDMVTEDYYNKEIAFQGQIDKANHTLNLKKQPAIVVDEEKGELVLDFPIMAQNLDKIEGNILFFRPSDESQDFDLEIALDDSGRQSLPLDSFKAGAWEIQVDWKEAGTDFFYKERVEI